MDIHTPSESPPLNPRDRIIWRLALLGVPEDVLGQLQPGLISFVKVNKSWIPELVSTILPTDEEVQGVLNDARSGSKKLSAHLTMKNHFCESMAWLQWLMFEGEPATTLQKLSKMSVGRGVCGAVWANKDIAFKCRTCEQDPTCAICVPCFQNGNHEGHDYCTIYTTIGCCDCGDATAWKREGFCSKHKGTEQIQPLPAKYANSVGPVLDTLFVCWKKKLLFAETVCKENSRTSDRVAVEHKKFAIELTFVVVEMLLEFCKCSESLLSFISMKVLSSVGLLKILVRAERFLADVKKLHELLLKLIGEPVFKHGFSKVFLNYYPIVVSDIIKENSDNVLKKYPLLPMFSVQIFMVPTLTLSLVKELNLLNMLLGCLGDIFISCTGEDGSMQAAKWGSLYDITDRVLKDIHFTMSHTEVPKYIVRDQQDILITWMRLLISMQGMNPLKRETGLHIEEENEHIFLPFALGRLIANIHSHMVDGAFSVTDDGILSRTYEQEMDDRDSIRHSKVGRLSQQSSACSSMGKNSSLTCPTIFGEDTSATVSHPLIPSSVTQLAYECLRAIENWLGVGNTSWALNALSLGTSNNSVRNFSALKRTLSKTKRGKNIFSKLSSSSEDHGKQCSSTVSNGSNLSAHTQNGKSKLVIGESDLVNGCYPHGVDDSIMDLDALRALSSSHWPNIVFDVSSQEISVYIPLHRLLSLLLHEALRRCFGDELVLPDNMRDNAGYSLSTNFTDFFGEILTSCHPCGFSAFLMEHPLRIRVFCAQVHAGMWRKNGDAALLSFEWYHSVCWSEPGLEADLFLMQYCAAMAPADPFVYRILERFGISNYLSLNPESSSEYEPVLVQDMLTLIIQIVKERRFCGLTKTESLKRELICKLAVGDTTHSHLVKSLPHDLYNLDHFQEILDTVAAYSNPSGFTQGTYSLRRPFWKDLDLYHPRWNSRDLQVAEERYMRFCYVSALTAQLPLWSKIYPPLKRIARIATSKAVLQIVNAVLFYAVYSDKSIELRAPDSVLLTALHLLSLALDICLQQRESSEQFCYDGDSIPILAFAGQQVNEGLNCGNGEQSLLSLLVTLMRLHKKDNAENFLEAGSCNISALIEAMLKKFAEVDPGCLTKVQQLAPEVVNHLSQSLSSGDTSSLMEASDGEKRKAKARERQAAMLEKMKAEQSKFLSSIDCDMDDGSRSEEEEEEEASSSDFVNESEECAQTVCSLCRDPNSKNPVSFLVLLQKSKLLSFIHRGPPSWEHPHQLEEEHVSFTMGEVADLTRSGTLSGGSRVMPSSQLAQLVQNALTEYSCYGQPRKVDALLEFLKGLFPALSSIEVPYTSAETERVLYSHETMEEDLYSICRNIQKEMLNSSTAENKSFSIMEGGQERITGSECTLVGNYMVALSREMAQNPVVSVDAHNVEVPVESSRAPLYDEFGPEDCDGIYLSSCGHAVHQECLDRYLSSLKDRYLRRIVFEGGHIVDPDQGEFLCPVCRLLANSVMPAYPGKFMKVLKQSTVLNVGLSHSSGLSDRLPEEISSLHLLQGLTLLQSAASAFGKVSKDFLLHRTGSTSPNLKSLAHVLSKMYFPSRHDKLLGSARVNQSMLMWDLLKYSLISMEVETRCGKTHFRPRYGLDALYKELESPTGFVMSMLLKTIQDTNSKNPLHVLQRSGGILCFSNAICATGSMDCSNGFCGEGMLYILKHLDMELSYSDVQFWSRACKPVLSRDPFSSLMWVLFSLPSPFLSCKDSLLYLVHIFYAVTITQAIIAHCGKRHCDVSEFGDNDCLVSDICKLIGESGHGLQYFSSNCISHSGNIKDAIRSLSFPYLRRCALLWRLLNSSPRAPFFRRDNALDNSHAIDVMERIGTAKLELNEVQVLENMLRIPTLDIVLKDEFLRSLASKWFYHFQKEFAMQRCQSSIYCNPAVPLQLMHLPRVYQDLLQRYVKQRCLNCKSAVDDPALCLLCGRLCSSSWKSCCRESGCQSHAMTCGAGTGIFLLIRRTTILLQRSKRQAPWPSPYLDAFGEEDVDMHRGKPLYLNEERYAALTYMVASHGLDRSSKVLCHATIGTFFTV